MTHDDGFHGDTPEVALRARMSRPLLAAAHGAADRLAAEARAMEQGGRADAMRDAVHALRTALFHLQALFGEGEAAPPTSSATIDVVQTLWGLAEEYGDRAIRVRIDTKAASARVVVDTARLRRVLEFALGRGAALSVDDDVTVRVRIEAERVGLVFPWQEDVSSAALQQEELRWLANEVASLGGVHAFGIDGMTVWLPREGAVPKSESPEMLAREVLDLRRERDTIIQDAERATGELVAIRGETDDLRRRISAMERSTAGAVNEFRRVFDAIVALASLVREDPQLGAALRNAAFDGAGRVDAFMEEIEEVTSIGAPSLVRDGTEDPSGAYEQGTLSAPRVAVFEDETTVPHSANFRLR